MLILGVKQIQLTVHCTEGELRTLSPDTNGGATAFVSVSPCLNIQFLPGTREGSFDVYGRDFVS